ENCNDMDSPQAITHTARARTTTEGRVLCFANVTRAGSKLPKRTALFSNEPLHSRSEAARSGHDARVWMRSSDSCPMCDGVSGILSSLGSTTMHLTEKQDMCHCKPRV